MPAPEVAIVRVPFYYAPTTEDDDCVVGGATGLDDAATFVTNVFIEVIAFEARFFWLYVSEESAGSAARPSPSPLGCCATAVASTPMNTATSVRVPPVSSTLWLDGANSVHGGGGGGMDEVQATTTTVQAAFASGLAEKVARRLQKKTGTPCVVHASCGVTGDMTQSLLGTDSGGGFGVTAAFGSLVFREALKLVEECIHKKA